MCHSTQSNATHSDYLYGDAIWEFPITWVDSITLTILISVTLLGTGLNGLVLWVKWVSSFNSFDLIQMNLAFSDMVIA